MLRILPQAIQSLRISYDLSLSLSLSLSLFLPLSLSLAPFNLSSFVIFNYRVLPLLSSPHIISPFTNTLFHLCISFDNGWVFTVYLRLSRYLVIVFSYKSFLSIPRYLDISPFTNPPLSLHFYFSVFFSLLFSYTPPSDIVPLIYIYICMISMQNGGVKSYFTPSGKN